MVKYLIFRTDRIGDFIFSRMLVQSIKNKYPSSQIDFVCSTYNSNYVKNFKDINKIYILDKYAPKLMLNNFLEINKSKYDFLIILDGKRRSIFFSLLLKVNNKIAVVKDFRPKLLLRFFFKKYFINSDLNSQFYNLSSIINYLDYKVPKKINYYENYKFKKISFLKKYHNFTLLHLDEKWFKGYYYPDYEYMDLKISNFDHLIKTIKKKYKNKIVITAGRKFVSDFNVIIKRNFKKKNNRIYISKKYKEKLIYIDKTDFRELETIVKKSKLVICCEGAVSHVTHAFKIRTIALINKPHYKTALFWTKHMNNISLIKRGKINHICKQLKRIKI